jgi:hypothetical protein
MQPTDTNVATAIVGRLAYTLTHPHPHTDLGYPVVSIDVGTEARVKADGGRGQGLGSDSESQPGVVAGLQPAPQLQRSGPGRSGKKGGGFVVFSSSD